jgi:hypothetical protein
MDHCTIREDAGLRISQIQHSVMFMNVNVRSYCLGTHRFTQRAE